MTTGSVIYWIFTAVSLYAAYLICFCMRRVDDRGIKTNERIDIPRILYLLTVVVSFVPVVNIIFGAVVIVIAIIAYYLEEDFYFKSWLFERYGDENEDKGVK